MSSSLLTGFCGYSFWTNFSYHNKSDLSSHSQCLEHILLIWTPTLFVCLMAPFFAFQILLMHRKRSFDPLPWQRLIAFKLVLTLLAILVSIFISTISLIHTSTMIGLFLAQLASKKVGLVSSGIILNSFLLHGICALPEAYYCYYNSTDSFDEKWRCSLFLTWFLAILAQIIAQCFADKRKRAVKKDIDEYNRSPELESSYLNRLFLCWFDQVAVIGSKKDLTIDDLFELNRENKSECLLKLWNDWAPKKKKLSFIYTIFHMFKWEFICAGLIKGFTDMVFFVNPFLLIKLLNFLSDQDPPLWLGVSYAFLMFFVAQVDSLCVNYYLYVMFGIGAKLQTALSGAIYNKTMKLSNSERRDRTGETVNLVSIDVERVQIFMSLVQQYWSSPFQITIALVFLYNLLGISALPGVFIMATFIPISFFISFCAQNYIAKQMKLKDQRIKLINEVLNGIKVIKLYNWELPITDEIEKIRKDELRCNFMSNLIRSILDVYNFSIPFLVALASFSTYTLIQSDNILTPSVAFVSLTLFQQIKIPMTIMSDLINMTIQAVVSTKRLKSFLSADEIDPDVVERQLNNGDESIKVENADFSWESSDPNLKDINLTIRKGSLIAVVGRVGSAKSSLISALLGEMEKLHGYVGINGQVAYVPQQPWILNMSLRENITFGRNYVGSFYDKVIETCELKPDLAILPKGDQTEIGEKGINLSGGQKARVSLARAVYQNADVYLLDDSLSAVDSHVGKNIFENVIGPNGMLRDKTRILVTHGITFLKEVDTIVHIDDGKILEIGSYEELMLKYEKFANLIIEAEKGSQSSSSSGSISTLEDTKNPSIIDRTVRIDESENSDKLIQAESLQSGRIKLSVYWLYISASFWLFILFVIFYVFYASFQLSRNIWLSKWADSNDNGKHDEVSLLFRLTIYASLGLIEILSLSISLICLVFGGLKASKRLHNPMLHQILKAPITYFDTTPLGRILNRFGKDIDVVDNMLPMNLRYGLMLLTNVGSTIFVICISTPIFGVVAIILALIYGHILKFYIPTSRQLKRLESNYSSPICSHFSTSIQGVTSIRAFNKTNEFCLISNKLVDKFARIKYLRLIADRWLGIRLELLGNTVTLFTALLAVISNHFGFVSSTGLVGLAVSYALNVTQMLSHAVRQISELENNIVSVERLKEYAEIDSEAESVINENRVRENWPENGEVVFDNYSTRYRKGLDLAIKSINVKIEPSQKVGIVGRTEAGKSTLSLAIFRMLEPAEGRIIIDGVDISKIGLHDLRSNITIIPQDPVLFSSTLRFNLDPFNKFSDSQLWSALEMAHLKIFVSGLSEGLDHKISEGGDNLSVGQRQLVCLARALLRRSKILVLDEVTSSVDLLTDSLIQETIRREFESSTVLTIAHRINTILDYDRVIVMENGEIIEFASPQDLLDDRNSVFFKMALNAKIVT